MKQTVVLNVVGLTDELLGDHTPNLTAFANKGAKTNLTTVTPAVTCSAQASFVTGLDPSDHGIVGNGWYFRDLAQVLLWRQNNRIVRGEKVWEAARKQNSGFTCAKMFWWYNMYANVEHSVTPRPMYPADGRKILDIYSEPAALGDHLKRELGDFPFFSFWGPKADIKSSNWIGAASRLTFDWHSPTLTLVYLPHLDYNLQRLGPNDPRIAEDLRLVDEECGRLIDHFQSAGARVVVLSEYGITQVNSVIHINRILREEGMIRVRPEVGLEMLDTGASDAFAVSDHQVAHVYVREEKNIPRVKALLEATPGIEQVLDAKGKARMGLNHERSGELVAISDPDKWFSYYYWLDDRVAPDFARTVDIHRKPGYDPVELFVDPKIPLPMLKVARILLKKKLGFRYLMDVIPLDASLVKGSHGRLTDDPRQGPLLMTNEPKLLPSAGVAAKDVKGLILDHLFTD